jgi:N-acetylmuramoyl-L-alanine amidase
VRFLLVHHTASTNDYTGDQVVDQIRGFYHFHTGPEKGWPDVAYNFFVDRFGGIWEGRAGSLAGPVRGDATGGSQGFSQLCSLIGNFQDAPVTVEQQASLTQLLAWLAETYQVDTTPGATVSFVSRGSNRWPAGREVTARTISGHRDMSMTSCPGDLAYALVGETLPTDATAVRQAAGSPPTTVAAATTGPGPAPAPANSGPGTVGPADTGPGTVGATVIPIPSGVGESSRGSAAAPEASPSPGPRRAQGLLAGGAGDGLIGAGTRLAGRRRHSPTGYGPRSEPPDRPDRADGSW